MTAKQDDTSKLVMRIILAVCGVACLFILNSVNNRLGRIEDRVEAIQRIQDIDGTTFRVKFTINDERITKAEGYIQELQTKKRDDNS